MDFSAVAECMKVQMFRVRHGSQGGSQVKVPRELERARGLPKDGCNFAAPSEGLEENSYTFPINEQDDEDTQRAISAGSDAKEETQQAIEKRRAPRKPTEGGAE